MSWEDDFQAVRKRALAQVQARGYAQGYAQGYAEGLAEARAEFIPRMYQNGRSVEEIAKIFGLFEKEVESILENANEK